MAQKLFTDKITQLSHSAGNILLASGAILTIGGQQYVTTTTLVVALPALTANNRYQVYAVISAGSPILVISQNENSVGPVGYNRWKLVGSLYANGAVSPAFGSFVNISGVPKTDWVVGGVNNIGSQSTPPTKGNGGTPLIDTLIWIREGNKIKTYHEYQHTTAGAGGGAGNYLQSLPFPVSSKYTVNTEAYSGSGGIPNSFSKIGVGIMTVGGANAASIIAQPFALNPAQVRIWCFQTQPAASSGGWGQNFFAFSNTTMYWSLNTEYESSSLSNTPIEDL